MIEEIQILDGQEKRDGPLRAIHILLKKKNKKKVKVNGKKGPKISNAKVS